MQCHARPSLEGPISGWGRGVLTGLLAAAFLLALSAPAMASTVSITLAGTGAGTVKSSPGSIDCSIEAGVTSGTCSDSSFANSASVTLSATPKDAGSVFFGWTVGEGGCTGQATTLDHRTPCQITASAVGGTSSLTAKFVPTPAPPLALTGVASPGAASYLRLLHGEVDPEGFRVSECRFEYGTSSEYGSVSPCVPGASELLEGTAPIPVSGETEPLEPNTTYHYRLFASNLGGAGKGEDRTFTTGPAPFDPCPNAPRRAEEGIAALLLPDCMALEQVSPPKKDSQPARSPVLSANGERALFSSNAALAGSPGVLYISGEPYLASRSASGWQTALTRPPAELNKGWFGGAKSFNPDLSSWLHLAATSAQSELGAAQVFEQGTGLFTPLSPLIEPLSGGLPETVSNAALQGASADHSHLVFAPGTASTTYFPGDPVPSGPAAGSNAYVAHRDSGGQPDIELLARDDAGKAWGGTCGARLGGAASTRGAISQDGLRSFITTRPTQPASGFCRTANKLRILSRTETPAGPQIEELVQNECSRVSPPACSTADGDDLYLGASLDQTRVYFTTTRQLANSDLDATSDLYLYDSTKPLGARLTQVSAGGSGDATPGSGASASSLFARSGDGSHAYFTSNAVLTTAKNPENREAEAGKPNLYLYEYPAGTTAFLGTLAAGDSGAYPVPLAGSNPAIGGDGHVLLFNSKANLSAADADTGFRDVFRYEGGASPTLQCVSCRPGAPDSAPFDTAERSNPNGAGTDFAEVGRWVSEDGQAVVLKTAEALVPGDQNGVTDSYLWRAGQIYRLPGTADGNGKLGDSPVLSHDGSEVAFQSAAQLLPSDGDDTKDVYVGRVGGGFPKPIPPHVCGGEECQQPFAAQPSPQGAGSEAAGAGNPSFNGPGKARCPKGRHRVKGRCVSQRRHKKHRKRSQERREDTSRRAAK